MRKRAHDGGRLGVIAASVLAVIVFSTIPTLAATTDPALFEPILRPITLAAPPPEATAALASGENPSLGPRVERQPAAPLVNPAFAEIGIGQPRTPANVIRGRGGISVSRSVVWGGVSLAAGIAAYDQSQATWGESHGRFHFKHDFKGDGMALSDETSHLFAAYRLTQVVEAGYRWTGTSEKMARRLAAIEAWLWMFAVEYPIDAYNPTQGFGVSDLLFNTAGVLAAYHRSGQTMPRWDVKISVKRQFFDGSARVIAYTNKQYDDYIYWLTVRPTRNRYVPLLAGAGYAVDHGASGVLTKELHLAVGTTLEDIGGIFGERTARFLRPLNFFFFNFGGRITWR